MQNLQFLNKRYLITGASSGIGKCLAIRLAKEGASLILVGRNEERLKETITQLSGNQHQYYLADLSKEQDFTPLFDTTAEKVKLDGLIYSAGVGPVTPVKLLRRAVIDEVMTTNLYSFLELVRLFANKRYSNPESSIVAISSIAAVQPEKCQTVYSMSKAALNASIQSLAHELSAKRIRINSVMPGMCDTEMVKNTAASAGDGYLEEAL